MRRLAPIALVLAVVAGACTTDDAEVVRIYTSVSAETVDAVVDGFIDAHPDVAVEVFRAPTGELAARLAAERREGGVRADVLWLTDPLSMQQYASDGLLEQWVPTGAAMLDATLVGDGFWGTRILTMIIVVSPDVEPPTTWRDLTDPRFAGAVAFPDPAFAGSSLGVLGYFMATDGYGIEFYEALAANGAVQVGAPGEVVTGVAEGRFAAGITLEFTARTAREAGSPIDIVWPVDGAITMYSPIATTVGSATGSHDFVEFVLSNPGQETIAATGWQPVLPGIDWEVGGPVVTVDWDSLADRRQEVLDAYRAVFGG